MKIYLMWKVFPPEGRELQKPNKYKNTLLLGMYISLELLIQGFMSTNQKWN